MRLYSEHNDYKLYQGSMLDMLEVIDKESIDAIVTDPPYELNFMGKGWDNAGVSFNKETWERCFEVLKEGGYLLAFGGTRTYHRIACAIEDAGFEIRDCIMWLYGSGFPKSMNIGLQLDKKEGLQGQRGIGGFNVGGIQEQQNRKAKLYIGSTTDGSKQKAYTDYKGDLAQKWQGWGTCLKPAYEPIIIARKPFKGSLVDNVIKNGVGGLNIDECRVGTEERTQFSGRSVSKSTVYNSFNQENAHYETVNGRFPANVIHDGDNETIENMPIANKESVSRYFYCAKASKKDRDEGLDAFEIVNHAEINNRKEGSAGSERMYGGGTNPFLSVSSPRKNTHPTVKPTELMQYLVRLIAPKGATILDPFNGSGSTGKAVMYENKERNANYKYIGIELTEEYLPIATARIEYAINLKNEVKEFEQLMF